MHSRLSGRKILTLKVQVPSKIWREGQTSIRCLLCANENAEGFAHMSSVLLFTPGFNVGISRINKDLPPFLLFCGVK